MLKIIGPDKIVSENDVRYVIEHGAPHPLMHQQLEAVSP